MYLYINRILYFMLQFHLLYYRNSFYNLIYSYCNNIDIEHISHFINASLRTFNLE